jgi:hypothetical protein
MIDRNREYLIETVTLLGPLRNDLVFVGGAVTGLLGIYGRSFFGLRRGGGGGGRLWRLRISCW